LRRATGKRQPFPSGYFLFTLFPPSVLLTGEVLNDRKLAGAAGPAQIGHSSADRAQLYSLANSIIAGCAYLLFGAKARSRTGRAGVKLSSSIRH
jgi:hypothetical protein